MKPGASGMVIGYQVGEFPCTWLFKHFDAQSPIYPGLMGKVSSLTYFLPEPGCDSYSFLVQAVAAFEQGLYFILTDSVKTLELYAYFGEPDGVPSLV